MICEECAKAGDLNRKVFDNGGKPFTAVHPVDCGCACQHEPAVEWDKYYSCPRPSVKDLL